MKKLIWTQSEIRENFQTCQGLSDLVERVEDFFIRNNQVVCELYVNDIKIDENTAPAHNHLTLEHIDKIELLVHDSKLLVEDALLSALEFIPQVQTSCTQVAEGFRKVLDRQTQVNFADTIQGCHWLVETLFHIRGASSNVGRPLKNTDSWLSHETTLMNILGQLSEAYQKQDYILVADILEYEVNNAMQSWHEVLKSEVERTP